jgi:MFS family permease
MRLGERQGLSAAGEQAHLPWSLAWRLALGQIVAWGILYYAFTVVVGPMQSATGWSRTFLNAGLSAGLLTWGLCALPIGTWIQRRGGRGLMTATSALGGAALVLMGANSQPALYFLSWLMLGASMAGLLYDSAFAVITAAFGPEYRRGITLITLVGGLASTVFIPIAQVAVDHLGWRSALILLGAVQAAIGVPLHWWGIPRFSPPPVSPGGIAFAVRANAWWRELRRDIADPRFVGLALWFTAHSAAFTGLIFQIIPILQSRGVPNDTMLQAVALIGPMQVLGRFALTARGDSFSTLRIGRWALGGMLVAGLVLLTLPPRFVWLALFATIYGASNGVMTILRGTSIAEFFGRERYAELSGALSAPGVLARAAAPLAMAGLWSATGEPRAVFGAVVVCTVVAGIGLMIATCAQRHANAALPRRFDAIAA